MNPYLADILLQPQALRKALVELDLALLDRIGQGLAEGRYDRILLTGMGASFYGLYPAWLHLAAAGLLALWVDTAELIHHAPALVGPRTLLWVASQSGRSAEIVRLVRLAESQPPAGWIALTNDAFSPLGQVVRARAADSAALLLLNAEPEQTPSTRTYLNTLAIGQLAALRLCQAAGQPVDVEGAMRDLHTTAEGIQIYLADWPAQLSHLVQIVQAGAVDARGLPRAMALAGRGPSLASAYEGALNVMEAVKIPALAFQAGEFRHGPLEMAGPELTLLIFAGADREPMPGQDAHPGELNRRLWRQALELGVNAWMISSARQGGNHHLSMPSAKGIGLPLAEIVPIQLLCLHLCQLAGIGPGSFRHIGKITRQE